MLNVHFFYSYVKGLLSLRFLICEEEEKIKLFAIEDKRESILTLFNIYYFFFVVCTKKFKNLYCYFFVVPVGVTFLFVLYFWDLFFSPLVVFIGLISLGTGTSRWSATATSSTRPSTTKSFRRSSTCWGTVVNLKG